MELEEYTYWSYPDVADVLTNRSTRAPAYSRVRERPIVEARVADYGFRSLTGRTSLFILDVTASHSTRCQSILPGETITLISTSSNSAGTVTIWVLAGRTSFCRRMVWYSAGTAISLTIGAFT